MSDADPAVRLAALEAKARRGEAHDADLLRELQAEVRYRKVQHGMAVARARAAAADDDRASQRAEALAAEDAFLRHQAAMARQRAEENLRDALDPASATASSNLQRIVALIDSSTKGPAARALTGLSFSQPRSEALSEERRRRSSVLGGDATEDFQVDQLQLLRRRGGRPEPHHPGCVRIDVEGINDDLVHFLGSLSERDENDEGGEGPEELMGASRAVVVRGGKKNSLVAGRPSLGRRRARLGASLMAAPIALPLVRRVTRSYCHDLAQLMNTLVTNNIIAVRAEEDPDDPRAARNVVGVLSPTDGFRLRSLVRGASDEPRLCYTSRAWSVKQALMERILAEELDIEYVAEVQTKLEDVHRDLRLAHDLLEAKDRELARCSSKCAALERAVCEVLQKSRQRREHTLRLALDIDETLAAMGPVTAVAPHIRRLLGIRNLRVAPRAGSRAFPSFYGDLDGSGVGEVDGDEMTTVLLPELKEVLARIGEARLAAEQQQTQQQPPQPPTPAGQPPPLAALGDFLETSGASRHADSFRNRSSVIDLSPTAAGMLRSPPSTAATTDADHPPVPSPLHSRGRLATAGSASFTGSAATPAGARPPALAAPAVTALPAMRRSELLALGGITSTHEELMAKLQRQIQRRKRRAEVEARMSAVERQSMEAEDCLSALSTVFRLGDGAHVKMMDVLRVLTPQQKEELFSRSAIDAISRAESAVVVCPCCRFEFDPSKPASEYRAAVVKRRGTTNPAARAAAAAAAKASATKSGARRTGKMVRAGSQATIAVDTTDASLDDAGDGIQLLALQAVAADMEKELTVAKARAAELEAGVDMSAVQRNQLEDELERMRVEARETRQSLNTYIDKVSDELDAKTAECADAVAAHEKLQHRTAALQRAAADAFEEVERIRALDSQLAAKVGLFDPDEGSGVALKDVAATYHRLYHQVCDQLRKAGKLPIDMFDVFCGSSLPISTFASSETQVRQTDLAPVVSVGVSSTVQLQVCSTQTCDADWGGPRRGIAACQTDALPDAAQVARDAFDPERDLGNLATTTAQAMQEYLVTSLSKACGGSPRVAEFATLWQAKEAQERVAEETSSLKSERARLLRQLQEQEEQAQLTVRQLQQQVFTLEQQTAEAKSESVAAVRRAERLVAERKLWKGAGADGADDPAKEAGGSDRGDRRGTPPVRIVDRFLLGDGADDDLAFQAIYTSDDDDDDDDGNGMCGARRGRRAEMCDASAAAARGNGRTVADVGVSAGEGCERPFAPIQAGSLSELLVEERARRRLLVQQYRAFCIPLPLLLALLTQAKREVVSTISAARVVMSRVNAYRDRQRLQHGSPHLGREAIRLPGITPGEELGVTTELPDSWYYDPRHAAVFRSDVDPRRDAAPRRRGRVGDKAQWRSIDVRLFPPIVPSERNDDGSYRKTHHYRQGMAHAAALSSPRSGPASPTELGSSPGSPSDPPGRHRRFQAITRPHVQTTSSIIIKSIAARLTYSRLRRRVEELQRAEAATSPSAVEAQVTPAEQSEALLLQLMKQQLQEQMTRYRHTQRLKATAKRQVVEATGASGASQGAPDDAIPEDICPGDDGRARRPEVKLGELVGGLKRRALQNITVKGFAHGDARKWQTRAPVGAGGSSASSLAAHLQHNQDLIIAAPPRAGNPHSRTPLPSMMQPPRGGHQLAPLESRPPLALASTTYEEALPAKREHQRFYAKLAERLGAEAGDNPAAADNPTHRKQR